MDMVPTVDRPLGRLFHGMSPGRERFPTRAELDGIRTFDDLCRYEDALVSVARGAAAIGTARLSHAEQDRLFTFGLKVAVRLLVGHEARRPYLRAPRFYELAYRHLWELADRCHPLCGCQE